MWEYSGFPGIPAKKNTSFLCSCLNLNILFKNFSQFCSMFHGHQTEQMHSTFRQLMYTSLIHWKKNHTGVFFTLWKDVPTMSLYVRLTTFLMWFTLLEYACNPNFPIEQWEKRLERCRIHSVARQRWVSSFEPSEHQWRLLSLSQTAETLIQTVAQRYHLLPSPHSSLISNRRTTNANLLH